MATRNKTSVFLQQRNSIRQTKPRMPASPEHVTLNMAPHMPGLKRGGGYIQLTKLEGSPGASPTLHSMHSGQDVPNLPPSWVDISERVKDDMEKIKKKMTELGKLQARALLPTFGAEAERGKSEHEEKIEVLTSEITRALKHCERQLQRLSADSETDTTATICRNIQRCMATDLQSLSMEFRRQSKQYLKRLQDQQQPKAQSRFATPPSSSSAGSSRQQHGGSTAEDDDMFDFPSDQGQLLRRGEKIFDQEREREMQEIFQNVQDLAQIMKDLSVLVIDQGTIVDRIDYNITQVSDKVKKGVEQLEKAEKMQKQSAMVGCIMCLIVACVILFVLLVLKKIFFLL